MKAACVQREVIGIGAVDEVFRLLRLRAAGREVPKRSLEACTPGSISSRLVKPRPIRGSSSICVALTMLLNCMSVVLTCSVSAFTSSTSPVLPTVRLDRLDEFLVDGKDDALGFKRFEATIGNLHGV